MADFSYEDFIGWGDPNAGDPWNSPMPADTPGWEDFTGWGDPTGPGSSGDAGGGNWWDSVLGGLGSVGSFLGQNAGTLGPLLSGAGAIAGGAIGSNAANEAARLQAEALNRGIDLQTAQWLQQQGNLAPYLQAGQGGLSQLQQLGGREQPAIPEVPGMVYGDQYAMPSATPGWSPQTYQGPQGPNAGDYRWNPQQGPQAQDYRWTPGQLPQASQYTYEGPQAVQAGDYRWRPGQGPSAADYRYAPGQTPDAAAYRYTPGAVPTLSGKDLLANDPGVQFRMDESRKALEGSAAARGDLLSGGNLKALQSRSQDLASQEYGQAWNRASQQAQLREQWGQAASQMGFGQAMDASRLREQLQQYATQQGWSQAQTEAVFREQMAQQASQQGFNQALGAQGQEFQQGFANRQYDWQRAQAEATLRENINQQASQQGWNQATAEAVFREQQAQLASQQGFNQALAGQQNAYTQGLTSQQWNQRQQEQYATQMYDRMAQQAQQRYAQDLGYSNTAYDRGQAQYRQQLAQHLLPWEQASTLANLGGQAVGMYGTQGGNATRSIADLLAQQGSAQGTGAYGSGLSWMNALTGAGNQIRPLLSGLNA